MVVTFGLTNALATFMCLINSVLNKFLNNLLLIFIDDILIYSKNKEEHEEHLKLVLQVPRDHKLYANLSKCDFFQKQVHYIGHVISEKGVAVDPDKIKSIMGWPTLKDVTNIISSMGLVGYYSRFIKGFPILVTQPPLYRENIFKFIWIAECEESFQ
jgi:hypothetical protein